MAETAAGRRDYNYFRDYDPATGRYIESDPIGLRGAASTYAYVGDDPLQRTDSLGLADTSLELYAAGITTRMPDRRAPQAAQDYIGGVGSYLSGLISAAKQAAWASGVMGSAYRKRADRNDAVLTGIMIALHDDPKLRDKAECYAIDWAKKHKVYIAGRYSAGMAGGALTNTGPVGSALLSGIAADGNVYGEIDEGANTAEECQFDVERIQGARKMTSWFRDRLKKSGLAGAGVGAFLHGTAVAALFASLLAALHFWSWVPLAIGAAFILAVDTLWRFWWRKRPKRE